MGQVPLSGSLLVKDNGPQFKTECKADGTPFSNLQEAHDTWPYRGIGHKRRVLNSTTNKVDVYEYTGLTEVENTDISKLLKIYSKADIDALIAAIGNGNPVPGQLYFAGIRDGIVNNLQQSSFVTPSNSWEMQLRVLFVNVDGTQILMSKSDSGYFDQAGWAIGLVAGKIGLYASLALNNYASIVAVSNTTIQVNTVYNVFIYRNATTGKVGISVNNENPIEANAATFAESTAPLYIGRDGSDSTAVGLFGNVGNVRMWSRLRDTTERTAANNSPKAYSDLTSQEKTNIVFSYDFLTNAEITNDSAGNFNLTKNGNVTRVS